MTDLGLTLVIGISLLMGMGILFGLVIAFPSSDALREFWEEQQARWAMSRHRHSR